MAMARDRKRLIADAFIDLCETMGVEKATVTALIERCGISRQTFYYHFQNIGDVVTWTLGQLFGEVLMKGLAMDRVHDALRYFIAVVTENLPFIELLLSSRWHNEVEAIMVRGVHTYLVELVRVRYPSLGLSVPDLDAALTLYSHGIVGLLLNRCADPALDRELLVDQIIRIISDTLLNVEVTGTTSL